MRKLTLTLFAAISASLIAGCATNFSGSPHVENGRRGCEAKCRSQGMEVAGMVFMGEYTSGCVCVIPGQAAGRKSILMAAGASAGAGAAGVALQMRKQQDAQQQQANR